MSKRAMQAPIRFGISRRAVSFLLMVVLGSCTPVRYTPTDDIGAQADYLRAVQHHIGQFAPSPREIKASGGDGTVVVEFSMTLGGQVRNATIQQSSGTRALDDLVIKMIYAASPMPPIPPHLQLPPHVQNGDIVTLAMPFKINQGIF